MDQIFKRMFRGDFGRSRQNSSTIYCPTLVGNEQMQIPSSLMHQSQVEAIERLLLKRSGLKLTSNDYLHLLKKSSDEVVPDLDSSYCCSPASIERTLATPKKR